jgi:hypothetical protein
VSPTCFFQDPIVPSVTVSPSFGIVMSCTTPLGTPTSGSAPAVPSEPPMAGLAGSLSAGPPPAATPCAAEGSRSAPAGAEPAPPIRISGVPTGTVSPSPTRISTTTPS